MNTFSICVVCHWGKLNHWQNISNENLIRFDSRYFTVISHWIISRFAVWNWFFCFSFECKWNGMFKRENWMSKLNHDVVMCFIWAVIYLFCICKHLRDSEWKKRRKIDYSSLSLWAKWIGITIRSWWFCKSDRPNTSLIYFIKNHTSLRYIYYICKYASFYTFVQSQSFMVDFCPLIK